MPLQHLTTIYYVIDYVKVMTGCLPEFYLLCLASLQILPHLSMKMFVHFDNHDALKLSRSV